MTALFGYNYSEATKRTYYILNVRYASEVGTLTYWMKLVLMHVKFGTSFLIAFVMFLSAYGSEADIMGSETKF